MESLTQDQNISHRKLLTMSTSPRKDSANWTECEMIEPPLIFNRDCSLKIISKFIRLLYSGTKIPKEFLQELSSDNNISSFLSNFDAIFRHPLLTRFPLRKAFIRNLLKDLEILQVTSHPDVPDSFFELMAECMTDSQENSYRIFLTSNCESVACVVQESNTQLCNGTTGLSIWQASCDLAALVTSLPSIDFADKFIVELGAGCGLAGIALARCFPTSTVCLTDYHKGVLEQLHANIHDNNLNLRVTTQELDWSNFSKECFKKCPDAVIAADVVYDRLLLKPLCDTIRTLIDGNKESFAIVACAERDPMTLMSFRTQIAKSDLVIAEETRISDGEMRWFGASCSLNGCFPFFSALKTVTVVFHLRAPRRLS